MAYGVFKREGHLGKGLVVAIGDENRIVSKTVKAIGGVNYFSVDSSLKKVVLSGECQGDNSTKSGVTVLNPLSFISEVFLMFSVEFYVFASISAL